MSDCDRNCANQTVSALHYDFDRSMCLRAVSSLSLSHSLSSANTISPHQYFVSPLSSSAYALLSRDLETLKHGEISIWESILPCLLTYFQIRYLIAKQQRGLAWRESISRSNTVNLPSRRITYTALRVTTSSS